MRELTQELEHWINHSCLRGEPRQTPQRVHCISKEGGQKNTKTWIAVGDQNRGKRDMFLVAKGKQNCAAERVSPFIYQRSKISVVGDWCNFFLEMLKAARLLGSDSNCVLSLVWSRWLISLFGSFSVLSRVVLQLHAKLDLLTKVTLSKVQVFFCQKEKWLVLENYQSSGTWDF